MSNKSNNPYKNQGIRDFLKSIPNDVAQENYNRQLKENEEYYKKFKIYFRKNKCIYCNHSLNSFNENEPCLHWLLLPEGIKKKKLISFLNKGVSFFQLESYLRWMSNVEKLISNINDLDEDMPSNAFYTVTIKFKKLEWTLTIGYTDKEGHEGAYEGASPHFHIQILRDDRIYLKFNDCHIPFTDEDLFNLTCIEEAGDIYKVSHGTYGDGPSVLEEIAEAGMLDEFDKHLTISDTEEDAIVRRQTIISAEPGKPISGDIIADAIEESKITKEPIGSILTRKLSDVNSTTIITPSDNIPNMKQRNRRKKENK